MTTVAGLNLLGRSRREFTKAKGDRAAQWRWELAASLLALVSSFLPTPRWAVAVVVVGSGCKLLAKWSQLKSRAAYRVAERARRLFFREAALGWRVRAEEYGDLLFSFSPGTRALAAETAAKLEAGYFAEHGEPGVQRMLANLRESMFWSERLSAVMATRRGWQCVLALAVVLTTLVAVAVVGSHEVTLTVVRTVAVFVVLAVTLDMVGEYRSFRRNEAELRQLASVAAALATQRPPPLEEALPLLVDYDCSMVERPLVPDAVNQQHAEELDRAWNAQMAAEARAREAT